MVRPPPVTNADLHERLTAVETAVEDLPAIKQAVADMSSKVTHIETIVTDISDIKHTIEKILRWVKVGLPSIISAAIAAGVVNGRLGAFFNALIQ